MKLGLISDIHGNLEALTVVLSELKGKVSQVFCLGDMIGYYPFPNEVISTLRRGNVRCIKGNHELNFIKNTTGGFGQTSESSHRFMKKILTTESEEFISSLPADIKICCKGVTIQMVHGTPWDETHGKIYPDFEGWDAFQDIPFSIILMGGTHRPFIRKIKGKIIANIGSVGQPRDGNPKACYAILDTDKPKLEIKRIKYDVEKICVASKAAGLSKELRDYLRNGGKK